MMERFFVLFHHSRNIPCYAVPDRLTAFQAYEELQELVLPLEITLNLILVNVTKAELKDWRESQIKDLLWPLDTVLDDR